AFISFTMSDLKIVSLNVKRINNVIKRLNILTFLKKENTKIALLSETHLTDNEHLKLRRNWVGQVFYSSHNSKSRGAAILIHHSLPFTLEKTMSDNDGYFLPKTFVGYCFSTHTVYCIGGGDFNCIHDPCVDQSPPRSTTTSRKSLRLREFCQDLELYDTWRVTNPRERDYTFFSQPHQTFSRIDFFLSSRMVLDRVSNCSISTCTISDRSPVILCISPPYADPAFRHWRMNPSLLSYPSFIDYITDQWNFFMDTNKTPDVNPSLLWETAKAFIRGSVISYTTAQKKAAIKEQLHLERTIQQTELQFKNTPSRALSKKLEAARSALNQLLTKQAESSIFFAKNRLYQSGNKPGRLLARLTKGRMEANTFSSLQDNNRDRQHKTTDINKVMREFYQKLYSSECNSSDVKITNFLSGA
uniref:exodeoxyribonuclease III n=1 Tax=Xiphophorus couchianus TaxID=32473 RepID=A0A3B5MBM6_9TELE